MRDRNSRASLVGAQIRRESRSTFVAQTCYRLALLLGALDAMLDRRGGALH